MNIKITSDSTCDLSPQQLEKHHIELFSLSIVKDNRAYLDGLEISPADIFEHVAAGGELCSTSAINPAAYRARFQELLLEHDAIIHLNISADFSCCYQNARQAAEGLENVYVIDSRNLSTGHGLLVLEAAEMAEAGMAPDAIAERLRELTGKVNASFIMDRLDYMKKGGRCSSLAALGANILRLKPCIEVHNGQMRVSKSYRGSYEKCVREYIKDRLNKQDIIDKKRIFITHTPVSPEAQAVAREAVGEYGFQEILDTEAGGTVSCHCGPGTLGVLFFTK